MVTAVTGVFQLFASAGLSTATIQSAEITSEQLSALFWVNIVIGIALTLLCMATAPVVVLFYNEPRLFWVTVAMSTGLLLTAMGIQHNALLHRQMRYFAVVIIEVV